MNIKTEWILCPVCGRKTHDKIREDTEMKNFPLYCPKYKQETLIDVKSFIVNICSYFSRGRARRCPASEPVKHPFRASGPSPQATLNGPDALLSVKTKANNYTIRLDFLSKIVYNLPRNI